VDRLSAFEPVERLTGLVGLVAQAGASLEVSLHYLHAELAGGPEEPGHVLHKYVSGVASLIEQCTEMVRHSSLPEDQREHAFAALNDAKLANQRRNDVVHGTWVWLDDDRLESWSHKLRKGMVSTNLTEDEVLRLALELHRVDIRLNAMQNALLLCSKHVPPALVESLPIDQLGEELATMRGEFDLVGPNAWQPHG
jgi:hypothetical protein